MTRPYRTTCRICGADLIRKREPIGIDPLWLTFATEPIRYGIFLVCPLYNWGNGNHTNLMIERPEGTPFPYPDATEELPFAENQERSKLYRALWQEHEDATAAAIKASRDAKADKPQTTQ